jgi:bacterioferritin-associated ferredoxin
VFVCICNGVTEKQIRDAVCGGADDVAQLRGCLGVGAGCGTCTAFAEQIISETSQALKLPENRVAA